MTRPLADLQAIKAELTNDPLSLGLTLLPEDDAANADKLNVVSSAIQIDRESIPCDQINKRIDLDEFAALSAAYRQYLAMVTASGSIDPSAKGGNKVREALLQMFGPGTETRTALIAILTEPANRVDQMFKQGLLFSGGSVTPSDISQARQVS